MVVLLYLGIILVVVGGLGTLIAAFKTGLLWGLGCLFIAPVSLFFLLFHWDVAKNPFFLQVIGVVLIFLGAGD